MMLMTKFGKFKLRLIATINLGVLLSVFNLASTTSNYWVKFFDHATGQSHFAGLWRSCPNQGPCEWRSGIVTAAHTFWSTLVRLLVAAGTLLNVLVVLFLFAALVYKLRKQARTVIRLLECGNGLLVAAFVLLLLGFGAFVANGCNLGVWLHVAAMTLLVVTANMLTRTFATLYFQSTRLAQCSKSCETGMSHAKLADAEERIALAAMPAAAAATATKETATELTMSPIEPMTKATEASGSNEALIPTAQTVAVVDVTKTATATQEVTTPASS